MRHPNQAIFGLGRSLASTSMWTLRIASAKVSAGECWAINSGASRNTNCVPERRDHPVSRFTRYPEESAFARTERFASASACSGG